MHLKEFSSIVCNAGIEYSDFRVIGKILIDF
jgi:hypothetical protein